jgi:hypothetical protein
VSDRAAERDLPIGGSARSRRDEAKTRKRSAIAILALIAGVLHGATPASAAAPCALRRLNGESIQHFSKRRIVCAVQQFGPVPGGAARAICIAKRESGLDPAATSQPTGQYRGLYQHDRDLWPARYEKYTFPQWQLSPRVLNGRTNAIVTVRMVADTGTWREAGWPPKTC